LKAFEEKSRIQIRKPVVRIHDSDQYKNISSKTPVKTLMREFGMTAVSQKSPSAALLLFQKTPRKIQLWKKNLRKCYSLS
jgi:hypothetical protein